MIRRARHHSSADVEGDTRRTTAGRLARYLPLVVWIIVIFVASSGQMSASETSRIIGPILRWLLPDINSEQLRFAHVAIRKTAHFVEYAVLALIAARAFVSSRTFLRHRWFAASLALVAFCALLDEFNQSFVSSRTGTIYDSLLDITGGLTALCLIALWRYSRTRNTNRTEATF